MTNQFPIFKKWVPEWLIKCILFSILLPGLIVFFLPMANINAAAGYYGSEPADIQFAVALFYAGYAGFYSLERRFFTFLASKEYFIIFTFLQIVLSFICYTSNNLNVLLPVRFIQGMLFASCVNLSLSLIFSRLHSEKAREISFSVFFGMLLCALPVNNLITADIIDSCNFNQVYKGAIFAWLPGFILLLISMNNVRLNVRFPLYKLDWQSFSLYSLLLILIAYIMIFGQEYYWLEDPRIRWSAISFTLILFLFILRQKRMKRPYTELTIFKFRNFKVGLFLLFIMYICRFASGITNTFFITAFKFDPFHLSYINILNIAGLVTGVIVSCCMLLTKMKIRYIWLPGFLFLLAFHVIMFFLFVTEANENNYFLPLFIQGLGVGMIMVPTIIYVISSVPVSMGASAANICLAVRYLGFCISIGIINYFELYEKSRHYNAFQDQLTRLAPTVKQFLNRKYHYFSSHGMAPASSTKLTNRAFVNAVNTQSHLRYAMDYYELMSWLLVGTIILVALFPYLNRTVIYLKSKRLPPA